MNWRIARPGPAPAARARCRGADDPRRQQPSRLWGPCVDTRGRFGSAGRRPADGQPARGRRPGPATTASTSSRRSGAARGPPTSPGRRCGSRRRCARASTPADLARSNYVGGGSALSIRSDLGTLNLSDVPGGDARDRQHAQPGRRAPDDARPRGRRRTPGPWCAGSGATSAAEHPVVSPGARGNRRWAAKLHPPGARIPGRPNCPQVSGRRSGPGAAGAGRPGRPGGSPARRR